MTLSLSVWLIYHHSVSLCFITSSFCILFVWLTYQPLYNPARICKPSRREQLVLHRCEQFDITWKRDPRSLWKNLQRHLCSNGNLQSCPSVCLPAAPHPGCQPGLPLVIAGNLKHGYRGGISSSCFKQYFPSPLLWHPLPLTQLLWGRA